MGPSNKVPNNTSNSGKMTMWLLGNRKEDGEGSSSSSAKFPLNGKAIRNKLLGKESPRSEKEANMRLAETFSGIEVSLSNDAVAKKYQNDDLQTMSSTPTESSYGTVISIKDQLEELRKPHFIQFQLPESLEDSPEPLKETLSSLFAKQRNHRIPLFRPKFFDKSSYDSVFHLLRSQTTGTELTLVRAEISLLDAEVDALQEDRFVIEKNSPASPRTKQKNATREMDINKQLLVVGSPKRVSSKIRSSLREERGLCLTVRIRNAKTLDAFLSRTAFRMGGSLSPKRKSPAKGRSEVILVSPDVCRDGGAGATIQHLTLLKVPGVKEEGAFFLSRDNGKSYCSGALPEHLQRRMKEASLDMKDLLYVAIGPHAGYYFVQFRSGDSWWSGANRDNEFDSICRRWDVHRVAFGGSTVFEMGVSSKVAVSWVVIGRDGKVAWKNIPRRLQSILENTKSPPSEISLGTNGSFFCKFIDGTMEWQLPSKTAEVCERLEREGSKIMSVMLSPEVTQDFIIRHR